MRLLAISQILDIFGQYDYDMTAAMLLTKHDLFHNMARGNTNVKLDNLHLLTVWSGHLRLCCLDILYFRFCRLNRLTECRHGKGCVEGT